MGEEAAETSYRVSNMSTDQNKGLYSKPEQMASLGLSQAAVNAVIIHWNCTANVLYNLTRLKKIREREHYEKIWSLYFPNNYGGTPQSSVQKIHLDLLLKARLKTTSYTSTSSNSNMLRDFLCQSRPLQCFIFQRFNDFVRGNT